MDLDGLNEFKYNHRLSGLNRFFFNNELKRIKTNYNNVPQSTPRRGRRLLAQGGALGTGRMGNVQGAFSFCIINPGPCPGLGAIWPYRPNLPDSNNFFLRILGFNHAPPAPEPGEELQLINVSSTKLNQNRVS